MNIEDAYLTTDEQHDAAFAAPITENVSWQERVSNRIAHAATEKALRWVTTQIDDSNIEALSKMLDAAKEEPHA